MRMWSCIPIPLDTTFSLTFSNYPIQKLMLYLTISSACPTTGSYEHVLGGGVTLTLVDEVALFVFISWSCANIIDGVYNRTVTVNLKGVETINGMSYVEGSFNGSGTLSNNKVYYTITYQCEIGGVIHNRIIQRNIDV